MASTPRVADEAAQHLARPGCRPHRLFQRPRIAALTGQRAGAGTDVAAHVPGAELRVELHAPGRLAPAERVVGVVLVSGEDDGALSFLVGKPL